MAKTPLSSFRLTSADTAALAAIAEQMGTSRSEAVRALIHAEVERRGLAASAAEKFIERLQEVHGADALLVVEVEGANVAECTLDDQAVEGVTAVLVHDADGYADLQLEDAETGASLHLATLYVGAGITSRHEIRVGDLPTQTEGA